MLARLANHWAEEQHHVTVVTLAETSTNDFPLSSNVHRVGMGLTAESRGLVGAFRSNRRRVAALRLLLQEQRPNVVVSFIEQANVLALLAARPLRIPVVISERTDPLRHRPGRVWEFLRRRVYHRCAALVVLTKDIAEKMRPIVRAQPLFVIPNGVAPQPSVTSDREQIVIAVGRLDAAKGYDRLLRSFALIADQLRSWRLTIVGDGLLRAELEHLAADLRLEETVRFTGRVADPSPELARASIFALTSHYEGFPNALLEAMASGLPAVAFDGSSAVRLIVRDGIDGRLVRDGDIAGFAAALSDLMSNDRCRQEMGNAAREVAMRFSLAEFFRKWDEVLAVAANRNFSQPLGNISE